ncbi:TonB-dependent siderophore receptor [Thalassospira povalilytica]|nr:TonB-dependent siderophore receptor [Thalassospira povalilytica]
MKVQHCKFGALLLASVSISGVMVNHARAAGEQEAGSQIQQVAQAQPTQKQSTDETATAVTTQPVTVTASQRSGDGGDAVDGYQPVSTSVATRTKTPLIDVPRVVNVVGSQVIEDQDARSLDDVLANVSGVTQTNTLGATQDAIIRRGFGSNRDDSILVNGLKVATPRSFNITVDHVEVVKGPASTLYGILDPGGMINIVTKKPQSEFGGEVNTSLTSFGGGNAGFDVTGPLVEDGSLSFRLLGDYEKTDYWRNFGETERQQIAPSLRWEGDETDITLSYFHEKYSVPFDRGTIFDLNTGKAVNVDPEIRFDEPYNVTKGKTDMVQFEVNQDLGDAWELGFDYSFSRNKYADNQARVRSYNASTGDVTRRADATQDSTLIKHSVRADLTGEVELAGLKNELLFGTSYDYSDTLRTDMIRCSNVTNFNIYNPVYGNLDECTNVSASDSDQTETLSTVSAYARDALHLNDQWILVGGLRVQYYDILAGKGRPFVTNTERYGQELIPNGGLVYKATPQLSLYTNVAKTFRPQSSIGSYVGNIAPEEGISYEVGTKYQVANGLTTNIALYTSEKNNVAYSEDVGGETVVKAAGTVRSRGLEIDVAGALTENLDIIASYGFTDARVTKDPELKGKRLANVARHTGSLFLAYDFGTAVPGASNFRAGGGVRAVGERPGTNTNTYDLPAYAVADMFASYTIDASNPITFQLNLKNIFDEVYYTSSIGTNNLGNQIGEPFQAILSAKVEF